MRMIFYTLMGKKRIKDRLAAHFKIMQAGSNSQITNCKKGSSGGTGKTFVSDS